MRYPSDVYGLWSESMCQIAVRSIQADIDDSSLMPPV